MANIPEGLTIYRSLSGMDALDASDTVPLDSPGFVDAFLTEFDDDDEHEGDHEGHYLTFAAVFDTAADAQQAFAAAVTNYAPPAGWGSTRRPPMEPPRGDQGFELLTGSDYGYPRLSVFIWRIDRIVLQAVDFHPYDRPRLLESIADGMATRAGGG
jgi:hypothetical protein